VGHGHFQWQKTCSRNIERPVQHQDSRRLGHQPVRYTSKSVGSNCTLACGRLVFTGSTSPRMFSSKRIASTVAALSRRYAPRRCRAPPRRGGRSHPQMGKDIRSAFLADLANTPAPRVPSDRHSLGQPRFQHVNSLELIQGWPCAWGLLIADLLAVDIFRRRCPKPASLFHIA